MAKRGNAEPKVGIFWLFRGRLVVDSMAASEGEPYAEARTHPCGHSEVWMRLQQAGKVPTDVEYEDPPRGRITYLPKDERFVVYADACILARKGALRRIMAALTLPDERTATSTDPHYRCSRCLRRGLETDPCN